MKNYVLLIVILFIGCCCASVSAKKAEVPEFLDDTITLNLSTCGEWKELAHDHVKWKDDNGQDRVICVFTLRHPDITVDVVQLAVLDQQIISYRYAVKGEAFVWVWLPDQKKYRRLKIDQKRQDLIIYNLERWKTPSI